MSSLAHAVQQLKIERDQAQQRVEQLEQALKVLSGVGALRTTTRRNARAQASGAKRRTISAVARKRMAAAQRARWAKWKVAQRKK
jgi:hypothetical protein